MVAGRPSAQHVYGAGGGFALSRQMCVVERGLRAIVWMLRAIVWMLRAIVWMLRAIVWMLRAIVWMLSVKRALGCACERIRRPLSDTVDGRGD
eukprot:1195780-Prorocentrum_minimum.AAC.3